MRKRTTPIILLTGVLTAALLLPVTAAAFSSNASTDYPAPPSADDIQIGTATFDDGAGFDMDDLELPSADDIQIGTVTFDDGAGDSFSEQMDELLDDLGKVKYFLGSDLVIGGELYRFYVGSPLGLTAENVTPDADIFTGTLEGRHISGILTARCGSAPVELRVVNPYEKEAPLSECVLAWVSCSENGTALSTDSGMTIGVSRRTDIHDSLLKTAYSDDGEKVVFKISPSMAFSGSASDSPYGDAVLTDDKNSIDLTFEFGGDELLANITFLSPAYLYGGLEDNVTADEIGELSEAQAASATSLRDDILGELARAFEEASVNVNIDQKKGTVRLANEVLFGDSSYELSADGQHYLDDFIRVYASVLLGGEFTDKIKKIEIAGHTDTNNTYEFNLELSENRAQTVYQYCLSSSENGMSDIQKEAFSSLADIRGYSFSDPIFTADGNVDMAASRRVEIKFYLSID